MHPLGSHSPVTTSLVNEPNTNFYEPIAVCLYETTKALKILRGIRTDLEYDKIKLNI